MRAGCMPDGEYDLGGQTVYVKNNSARIENGSLAGSVLTLNKAVYNFKENTNLNIYEAINLTSLNPATCSPVQILHLRTGFLFSVYYVFFL